MRFLTRILPLSTVALALPALALTAPAVAGARTVAPPGNSAISQYLEVVPSSTGATPPGTGGTQGGVLTPSQTQHLERLGPNGRTLAAVVEETAPAPDHASVTRAPASARASDTGADRGSRRGLTEAPVSTAVATPASAKVAVGSAVLSDTGARSPASMIFDAAAGGGGGGWMGVFLPAFMVASALGAAAYAVRRRRTGL